MKRAVELSQHFIPGALSVGDVVKFFFNPGSKIIFEDILKKLHQETVHNSAQVGRDQFSFITTYFLCCGFFFYNTSGQAQLYKLPFDGRFIIFLNILSFLNGGDGRGIS